VSHILPEQTQQDTVEDSRTSGRQAYYDIAGERLSKEQRIHERRHLLTELTNRCTCDCLPHCSCRRSPSTGAARSSSACRTPSLGVPDSPLANDASNQDDTPEPRNSVYRQASIELAFLGQRTLGRDVTYSPFPPWVDNNSSGGSVGGREGTRDTNRDSAATWSTVSTTVEQNSNMTDDQLVERQDSWSASAYRPSPVSSTQTQAIPRS